jgi:hypothetical protein
MLETCGRVRRLSKQINQSKGIYIYRNVCRRYSHNNYDCEKGHYCNNSLLWCKVKATRTVTIVCGWSIVHCIYLFNSLDCSVQTHETHYDEVQERDGNADYETKLV